MGCCDKIQKVTTTAKQIVQGWTALARGKKYEFTDDRVRVCQDCEDNYWLGRTLWCSICYCAIAAAARVAEKDCPKGRWPAVKSSKKKKIRLAKISENY